MTPWGVYKNKRLASLLKGLELRWSKGVPKSPKKHRAVGLIYLILVVTKH